MKPFSKFFNWLKPGNKRPLAPSRQRSSMPLREFVYLDEVSLRSLLSSQKNGMTEVTSEQLATTFSTELGGSVSAEAVIAKSQIDSKFQTSNSSALQTSRKATVQSWFRELIEIKDIRLVEVNRKNIKKFDDISNLINSQDKYLAIPADRLARGELLEIKILLSAHPTFHVSTLASEFSGMVEENPNLFTGSSNPETLKQVQGFNRVLQRLLTGLIPIQAKAVDYVVAEIEEQEYLVHKNAISGLNLETKPLEIVGVTEHLAYWKDIRRVLFSQAEFTVLARVARGGLHDTWAPVKLTDMLKEIAPGLAQQMSSAHLFPLPETNMDEKVNINRLRFKEALNRYKEGLLNFAGATLGVEETAKISDLIEIYSGLWKTASDQRTAFSLLKRDLGSHCEGIDAAADAELRETARNSSNLALFPALALDEVIETSKPSDVPPVEASRLLDVEFVAMYW